MVLLVLFQKKPGQCCRFLTREFPSPPVKQVKYMIGAVMPEMMSKFLPAKVIKPGISLCVASKYNITSTGIRTICTNVNLLRSRLSLNDLPFFVTSKRIMSKRAGTITSANLGGTAEVF